MCNHPVASKLVKMKTIQLKMRWRTKENALDCGVFTMHHMERYRGQTENEWKVGLSDESKEQEDQLTRLRIRFAAKILSHEINTHADKMMKNAITFARLHPDHEIKKMVLSAISSRSERVKVVPNF